MSSRPFVGLSGPAALVGGFLWSTVAVLTALKPEGCIAGECDLPGRSMREGGALEGLLFLAAALLIGFGLLGVAMRARDTRRFGRLGGIGMVVSIAGGPLS